MNKKAAGFGDTGVILIAFVGVIIALAIATAVFGTVGVITSTNTHNSHQVTAGAANKTVLLDGQKILSVGNITNATFFDITNNFTIVQDTSTGVIRSALQTEANSPYASKTIYVNYTYEPQGYIEDAGARSVTGLISIMAALAIAVIALVPGLRHEFLEMIGR